MNQLSLLQDTEITEYTNCDDFLSDMPKVEEIYQTAWKMWYVVQDHKKIMCSISGGYDSDIMLDMLIRCGARKKTSFVFYDTGLEYSATKEHIKYLEEKYHIDILRVRPKKPIPICCKNYGVPFWNKYVSDMIRRLQIHRFQWENETLDVLLSKYPRCRSSLRWWCNDWGDNSRFNISYIPMLKEFLHKNPPNFAISSMCCDKAKKEPAHDFEETGEHDIVVTGVRRLEGGKRATTYKSCYDERAYKADLYRPLFWWSNSDKEAYRRWFGIVRSDCYEVWGMERTGCAGCPFGKDFDAELELVQKFEPKRYRAMMSVFGESYDYTREFMAFRGKMKKLTKETDENQTTIWDGVNRPEGEEAP